MRGGREQPQRKQRHRGGQQTVSPQSVQQWLPREHDHRDPERDKGDVRGLEMVAPWAVPCRCTVTLGWVDRPDEAEGRRRPEQRQNVAAGAVRQKPAYEGWVHGRLRYAVVPTPHANPPPHRHLAAGRRWSRDPRA